MGDNLGVVNRPNYGGNNFGVNNFSGGNYFSNRQYEHLRTTVLATTRVVNGGWGGGGWGGGGWGGGGWGGGGWGGGGWRRLRRWLGRRRLGVAVLRQLVSRRLGQRRLVLDRIRRRCPDVVLDSARVYGGYGYGYPALWLAGVYNYFPTWGMSTYSGWGLGSVANTWLYSNYTNPYYATVVAAQPAQTTIVYDYSQPINVTAAPPDASVAESTEQVFSAARDSFKAGDYQRALDLADQVLKQTPNAAVVHEFRALALFALKRYDEAAAVDLRGPDGRTGLELVDHGRALSRRRHLHQPASRPGSLRQEPIRIGFRRSSCSATTTWSRAIKTWPWPSSSGCVSSCPTISSRHRS